MKKSVKTMVKTAAIIVLVGIVGVIAAIGIADCDFTKFNTAKYVTETSEVTEDFENIDVMVSSAALKFVPSAAGGKCKVVCHDREQEQYSVTVEDGALKIARKSTGNTPFEINITESPSVTIYLPKKQYKNLTINTSSGDVSVPSKFKFSAAYLVTSSGNIEFSAETEQSLRAESTSGNITARNARGGNMFVSATSGDISICDSGVDKLNVVTGSGGIKFENVDAGTVDIESSSGSVKAEKIMYVDATVSVISGDIEICDSWVTTCLRANTNSGEVCLSNVTGQVFIVESTSGDIKFDRADAFRIKVNTTSGDVSGSLQKPKRFIVRTTSGDTSFPEKDRPGTGTCIIDTVSGDVDIVIAP